MRIRWRKVGVDRGAGELDLPAGATPETVLRELRVSPETVLVARGGTIVPVDELLADGDELHITRIVTGG
jgi:sulfur carrier protein ThiS